MKKTMKKHATMGVMLAIILTLSACGQKQDPDVEKMLTQIEAMCYEAGCTAAERAKCKKRYLDIYNANMASNMNPEENKNLWIIPSIISTADSYHKSKIGPQPTPVEIPAQ
jgi:hypothetical protein